MKKLNISLKGTMTDPSVRLSKMKIIKEMNMKIYHPKYEGFMLNSISFEASKIVQKKINVFYFYFRIFAASVN